MIGKEKVISFILAISVFSLHVHAQDITKTTDYDMTTAEKTVTGLGIMSDTGFSEGVTRGEFASIIGKLCRLDMSDTEWQKTFFGDEASEKELKTEVEKSGNLFDDVARSDDYCFEINSVANYRIMEGVGENKFYPDREVSFVEVCKTLIKIAGYVPEAERLGGYPNGYISLAGKLGISKYVYKGDTLSKSEIAQMIYNLFDVNVMMSRIDSGRINYYIDEEKNVLSFVLGMKKLRGTMTQNTITDLHTPMKSNRIIVDGKALNCENNIPYVNELLAHEVIAYYDEEDNVVWADKTANDESIIIDGSDILKYVDGVLTYETDKKENSIRIESGTPVIYNGLATGKLNEKMFAMQSGTVEVITNNSKCDTVVITNYKTVYVSGVNTSSGLIYNKTSASNADDIISVDEDKYVIICDADRYTDISAIKAGSVLNVAQNDYAVRIMISENTVSGKITSVSNGYIYINEKPYIESRQLTESRHYIPAQLGSDVKAYLDFNGIIAWMDIVKAENSGGYLIKAFEEDGTNKLKIFTLSAKTEVYEIAEKLKISDENGNNITAKGNLQTDILNEGYIQYLLNSERKISKVIIPLKCASDDNRLYEMINDSMEGIVYKEGAKCFSGKAYIGNNTVIIKKSSDGAKTELSICDDSIFENDKSYKISAYSSDPYNMYADVIFCANDDNKIISEKNYLSVVEDISDGININDEPVRNVTIHQDGKTLKLMSLIENDISAFENASDAIGSNKYNIQKGDIIRYSTDTDGYVDKVELVYSPYLANPSGGSDGYLAGIDNDKYMISKGLVDRVNDKNNIYSITSSSQSLINCNPYAVNNGSLVANAFRFQQYNIRTMLGYVYSVKDNFITITTQDLTIGKKYSKSGIPEIEYIKDDMTGVYIIDTIKYERFHTTYVTYSGNMHGVCRTSVRSGDISDIKAYRDYGSKCSKIICILRSGEPHQLIIINDERN